MNQFQRAVQDAMSASMRSVTHPVRGRIPAGGIDYTTGLCRVEIPNPKSGKHPGGRVGASGQAAAQDVMTFYDVPLPHTVDGVIGALLSMVQDQERAVTVGFRGGNMAHPYIIAFGSFLNSITEKPKQRMDGKKPATAQKTTTKAAPFIGPPLPRGFALPTAPPLVGPPVPPGLAASATTAQKSAAASDRSVAAFQHVMNRSTEVTVRF